MSQWMQPHRWTRAIHLSGTVWVVVDEHYIPFTSTIAQLCERSSRNVACQSSSYLQRASILIQSNCCLTTENRMTSDQTFQKTGNRCRSRKFKRLFENTWMRRRRVRYLASSVPVQTAKMQLQIKSCNFVLCTRRRKVCVSIARRTIYIYLKLFIFIYLFILLFSFI